MTPTALPITTRKEAESNALATVTPPGAAAVFPEKPAPRHVAIIMDGNGRWAAARNLPRWAGHQAGIAAVRRTVEEARRGGVRFLTLYAFSTENWRRSGAEIAALWELLSRFLICERSEMKEKGIRLVGIGRRDRLPLGPRTALELTERLTGGGRDLLLRLALDYGAQWSIVEASRRLALRVQAGQLRVGEIDEARFDDELRGAVRGGRAEENGDEVAPPPDLLIRTGGEYRLSNFLLWECAYAELWFTPTLWPDFERSTFAEAIEEFARRRRRFGAAAEQPAAASE